MMSRNTPPRRPRRMLLRVLRAPVRLYHWRGGWLLGHRFLLLTHRGRRSGQKYETVLEVLRWDATKRQVVVMCGFGPSTDWYRNVTHGDASITIGREHHFVTTRVLPDDEAADILQD